MDHHDGRTLALIEVVIAEAVPVEEVAVEGIERARDPR
jgi:hypothetical protein